MSATWPSSSRRGRRRRTRLLGVGMECAAFLASLDVPEPHRPVQSRREPSSVGDEGGLETGHGRAGQPHPLPGGSWGQP